MLMVLMKDDGLEDNEYDSICVDLSQILSVWLLFRFRFR